MLVRILPGPPDTVHYSMASTAFSQMANVVPIGLSIKLQSYLMRVARKVISSVKEYLYLLDCSAREGRKETHRNARRIARAIHTFANAADSEEDGKGLLVQLLVQSMGGGDGTDDGAIRRHSLTHWRGPLIPTAILTAGTTPCTPVRQLLLPLISRPVSLNSLNIYFNFLVS